LHHIKLELIGANFFTNYNNLAMRNILILLTAIISINTFGQIGGLSSTKISSLSAGVLPNKTIEFEPGFYHSRSSQYWDANSSLQNTYSTSDSISLVTGMYFRITYGLWNKIELGVSISNDMSQSNWGIRYNFFMSKKIGLAFISGMDLPWGNKSINERLRINSNIGKAGFGLVGSIYSTENLSFDFSAQYMQFLKQTAEKDKGGYYLNFDAGYYILKKQVQIMAAAQYSHINNMGVSNEVLTFIPGFSVETGNNYAIALAFPLDIYGKRETKNTAINFALTLNFD